MHPATSETLHSVTSADGTSIAFRQIGHGPAIVVLHGSMQAGRSHLGLAQALADAFTVLLPDRRGRGSSGPAGTRYAMAREVEDLQALLQHSGATRVFGVSSSGLVALQSALVTPAIEKVAVYEPALLLDDPARVAWLPRFDSEIADGAVDKALVTSMKGLQLGGPLFARLPRPVLEAITRAAIKREDRATVPAEMTLRRLAPTLHHEGALLAEMNGSLDTFNALDAQVLLLGGSKGLSYVKPALDRLETVLPHARRTELRGLDHGGPADKSTTNPHGRPEVVAAALRRFFA